jgi:uncharacterized OB-fold protein
MREISMTVHSKMFDDKKKEQTYHRVYVEFEGGYWISLGVLNPRFQEMVELEGRPVKVEFRATDEGLYEDDGGEE